jgi:hypothetical protein
VSLRVAPGDGIAVTPVAEAVGMGPGDPAAGQDVLLPLPYVSQRPYTNLCWAACVEMVFRLNGVSNVPMCQMCSMVVNHDCCDSWEDGICDRGHWPQDIYAKGHFNCESMNAPATPQSVKQEIDAGRPVEVFYKWNSGSFHTALIYGYCADGRFAVADPWFGETPMPYESIVDGYGRGGWMVTYYHLGPSGA